MLVPVRRLSKRKRAYGLEHISTLFSHEDGFTWEIVVHAVVGRCVHMNRALDQ